MAHTPPSSAAGQSLAARTPAQATPAFSPLYQQIKGLILQSLQAGEWKPGEAIPSEMELAARFRVSQGTVRKAIDELAAENLVVRRQGKGTFVATHAEQHVQYRFLKLMPDTGDLDSEGPAQRQVIECRACAPAPKWPAPGAAHRATRCCRRAACCRLRRAHHSGRHLAAGRPSRA
jgi:GntR family transcriptional regulator